MDIRKLQERITSDDEFAASVIKYMEDLMKQSLTAVDEVDVAGPPLLERKINPDSEQFEYDLEKDSNLIAKRFNMHKHTSTCRKYRSGEQSCRFGAPWELVEESYKDEVGVVHMKRNEPYINKWNDTMATTLRCNHDISFLPTISGFLSVMYYITDYTTKLAKLMYHYFLIAVGLMEQPSEKAETADEEGSDFNKSRRFLARVFNKTVTSREISGPEIANVMIGQPECYTNLRFVDLNYNSLYSEMLAMFPHLRRENEVENEKDHEDTTVSILDRSTATDQFSNYRYHSRTLAGLCLYDYSSIVYTTEASAMGMRQSEDVNGYVRFSREHPLHDQMIQYV